MITILDTEHLKISIKENDTQHVTLCFTGIGHALGGVDVQGDEFLKASQTSTAIFLIDKLRSWGNSIDFIELNRVIRPFIGRKTVNAIGNSMGGYLAILASRFIEISTVVAFAPQWSVSKQIIPNEHRWDQYVNEIHNWRFLSLDGAFGDGTMYYVIAGIGGDDDKHLRLFPTKSNIQKLYFTGHKYGHNIAKILKDEGVLYDVIHGCFSRNSADEIGIKHLNGHNSVLSNDLFVSESGLKMGGKAAFGVTHLVSSKPAR